MKVGLSIVTDAPGGAEMVLLELSRKLQARGHEVIALGPSAGEGWLTEGLRSIGVTRIPIGFGGALGLGSVPDILSVIREHRLDVLHSHEYTMAVSGALAARVARCRHLITLHGGMYHATRLRRKVALRSAVALSAHTVAVSEAFRRRLAASLSIPAASLDMVPNGVTPSRGDRRATRRALGIEDDDVLILAVGSLYPVKGHEFLIEAMSRMGGADKRAVVVIAGQGQEEDRLRDLARRRGVADSVRLLGFRSDIPDLLAASDVFVMPSRSEGMPMAMIEAMLAEKAIVASDVGGIPELIAGPHLGVLVEPENAEALAEALTGMVSDPEKRARMGRAVRARAEAQFSSDIMVDRYLELYRG